MMMTRSTRFRAPRAGALCPLAAGLLAVFALAASGCGGTTAGSFQSRPTSVPLVERNYTFVAHGMRGEACKRSFLGFGIGDRSYAEAINRIHQTVPEKFRPEYQLVNVVDDWTFDFYLLVWRSCTVVSADVVVLREPVVPLVMPAGAGPGENAAPAADAVEEPPAPAADKPKDKADSVPAPAGKPAAKAPEKPKPKPGKGGIVSPYED
jgi:hypothetical protein